MTTTNNTTLDLSGYSVDFENWLQVHVSLHGKPLNQDNLKEIHRQWLAGRLK
jgi:hypothetical protein